MGRITKLSIPPITPTIGAEVEGVDLSAPLDASEVADIRQALLDHLVLFLRDQKINPSFEKIFINSSTFFLTTIVSCSTPFLLSVLIFSIKPSKNDIVFGYLVRYSINSGSE